MNPCAGLADYYRARGAVVHEAPCGGFIVAYGKTCGRVLYRIHPRGSLFGLDGLVLGKATALAALAQLST